MAARISSTLNELRNCLSQVILNARLFCGWGLAGKTGTPVTIYYNSEGNKHIATRIEVREKQGLLAQLFPPFLIHYKGQRCRHNVRHLCHPSR
jgi:hypothetical protein